MSRAIDFVRSCIRVGRAACVVGMPGLRSGVAGRTVRVACALLAAGTLFVAAIEPPHAAASGDDVRVFLRVEGPAERASFPQTGEYVAFWSGYIDVPREVTITAASGRSYRLFVQDGRYLSTRLDNDRTEDLGPADDARGATSVLAALHQASIVGGFSYQVTDAFYPGMGFLVTSIGGVPASGAVGWSYRVWNDSAPASPQVSVERFLLGYDTMGVTPPHTQVLFYWGYATRCLPLRVTPLSATVRCGLPSEYLVEAYVESGYGGYWRPVEGAVLRVDDALCVSGPDGIAETAVTHTGILRVDASAAYDGDSYYIPADGLASIDVQAPCAVVSLTLIDHGEPGINFGYVVPGSGARPERAQTGEHGAVTLVVGEETSVHCVVQLRAASELSGDSARLPLSAITWGLSDDALSAAPMSTGYADIGAAPAGSETSYEVWHWLSVPPDQAFGVYSGMFYYRVTEEAD